MSTRLLVFPPCLSNAIQVKIELEPSRMKKTLVVLASLLLSFNSFGGTATLYWDRNGSSPGVGGNPDGYWGNDQENPATTPSNVTTPDGVTTPDQVSANGTTVPLPPQHVPLPPQSVELPPQTVDLANILGSQPPTRSWSTDASGSSATGNWPDGAVAIFAAGSQKLGSYKVTPLGKVPFKQVFFQNGNVTIDSGILEISADAAFPGTFAVSRGLTARINSIVNRSDSGTVGGLGFIKMYGGTLEFSQKHVYTNGEIQVRGGTLRLAAADILPDASPLILAYGEEDSVFTPAVFDTGGFNETLGPLAVTTPDATIDFGNGASALVFADSDGMAWTGDLKLKNYTAGSDSLKIGTDGTGFNVQLARIRFLDIPIASNNAPAKIDATGLITPNLDAPVITQHPKSLTVAGGSSASFTVTATNNPPFVYQWQFKGNDLQNATNQTLSLPFVDERDAGEYTVIVSNASGNVISAPATLTVTNPDAGAPRILTIHRNNDQVLVTWTSVPGRKYGLETTIDLEAIDWLEVGTVNATNGVSSLSSAILDPDNVSGFFRVRLY